MSKKKKQYLLLLLIGMILIGFGVGYFLVSQQNKMPETMPGDFAFDLRFGITSRNEINTLKGTFTKDLVTAGTVTTKLTFTKEELQAIYNKMKEINIVAPKKTVPIFKAGERTPFSEDFWEITLNGKQVTLYVTDKYIKRTRDAQDLIELREYIFTLVQQKEEYKKLPPASGGYA